MRPPFTCDLFSQINKVRNLALRDNFLDKLCSLIAHSFLLLKPQRQFQVTYSYLDSKNNYLAPEKIVNFFKLLKYIHFQMAAQIPPVDKRIFHHDENSIKN